MHNIQVHVPYEKQQNIKKMNHYTYAQLPFQVRFDPLKLSRDLLKVVTGSLRVPLKILANGTPAVIFSSFPFFSHF